MDATREEGLRRLRAFINDGVGRYSKDRNFDRGEDDKSNVSVLSPFIRHRLILESEVISDTLQAHSKSKAAKFIDEVFWRAYFKGWLQHHPTVWSSYRDDVRQLSDAVAAEVELEEQYNQAVSGNTGIDCFDAWAKELVTTGYLHNHARMWFASIWIFTLKLPWQLGADFFLRHLLDGDPASNTLSWRWVGGLHTRGKTYLARVSNIASYTEGRFAPHGKLATQAPPLVEDVVHRRLQIAFPSDATLGERYGLLLTEDDLGPKNLPVGHAPQAVLGLAAPRLRSPLPIGVHAHAFATDAVQSAVTQTSRRHETRGDTIETDNWQDPLSKWASQHQLDSIVLARPTIGPVHEAFEAARPALESAGVTIIELTRDYDRATWPHASRGFFKLKKHIDVVIEQLGLGADRGRSESAARTTGQRDFIDELTS